LKSHLGAEITFQPEQERVLKLLQLVLDDGKEFTVLNLNVEYRWLNFVVTFFTAGLRFVKYLEDPTLQHDWTFRLLDQACPCLERATQWGRLVHVRTNLSGFSSNTNSQVVGNSLH